MEILDERSLQEIKQRWLTESGQLILDRLRGEKLQLKDMEKGMKAAQQPFSPSDLRGINLSKNDLSDQFLLFDLDLSYSNFAHSQIQGSFQNSKLILCDFSETKIIYGHFVESNLYKARFDNATILSADFEGANLEGASFAGVQIHSASFVNVDLTGVDFSHAKLAAAKFGRARIKKSSALARQIEISSDIVGVEKIIWIED
jgi:uncharacterized protein YjbI with pentapeptide repeats